MTSQDSPPEPLTLEEVRKVARLSRLELTPDQLREQQTALVAVLGYVDKLRDLDTEGLEPMANPAGETNRLGEDVPAGGLSTESLMAMAPSSSPPFVTTPKVTGDGGGA